MENIAEEDDRIVEKQPAAAVASCFSKKAVLGINFRKNAEVLRIRRPIFKNSEKKQWKTTDFF